MTQELRTGGQKLYLTITTKPLSVAVSERLPAVYLTLTDDDLDDADLVAKLEQARTWLTGKETADAAE